MRRKAKLRSHSKNNNDETMSYTSKKKDLAAKGMPDPKVGKNVKSGDKKAEMGNKSKLIIDSTHDARAHSSDGKWHYSGTGERTTEEIKNLFKKK